MPTIRGQGATATLNDMGFIESAKAVFGYLATGDPVGTSIAEREAETPPTGVVAEVAVARKRRTLGWSAADRAMTLTAVYRSCFVHATAATQLGIDTERDNQVIASPALVTLPDVDTDRTEFVEYTNNSLWMNGNAYWHHIRADRTAARPGEIVSLKPLNPAEMTVRQDPQTGRVTYHHLNKLIPAADISHLKLFRVPGLPVGLGPIQAARLEIEGAIDARDYGAAWFSESGMPSGVLTSDQTLSQEQATMYRDAWNSAAGGHGVRVLSQGLSYSPLLLKPADVQFLESQQFSTTNIARLFGIPAGMMLAAVEGGSRTYNNIIDEWRSYLQFSAMKAFREIETKWSKLLPGKQRVKFNMDAFLRLDTPKRYAAHRTGIEAGFLTINEVRRMEGLPDVEGGNILAPAKPSKELPSA